MKKLISFLLSAAMAASTAIFTSGKNADAASSSQSYSYSYSYSTSSDSGYSYSYRSSGSSSSSAVTTTYSYTFSYGKNTTTTSSYSGSTLKLSSGSSTYGTSDRQKYLKYFSVSSGKTMADTTIHLNKSNDLFTVTDKQTWYFYHFNQNGVTGIGINGDQFHCSGYGQMYAQINNGRYLTVDFSSFSSDIVCKDMTMTLAQNKNAALRTTLDKTKNGNTQMKLTADLYDQCFMNGIYEIDAKYTFNGNTEHCQLYLFVNCASDCSDDYEFYICYGETHNISEGFDPAKRRMDITDLLASEGVTTLNSLDPDVIYPYCSDRTNRDTEYWIKKSHEILDSYGSISTGRKILLLHDWMTSNLKYDYYKVNVLKFPRFYVGGVLDTSQYLSKNYTGVCLDFSCIFAIMCREAGIPCVVLSNSTHAWSAVYVSGDGWIEVDLTQDVNRVVYGSDLNKVTGSRFYCYDGFATYNVNDCVPDTAVRFCF